jgi:small GTP-binding protein
LSYRSKVILLGNAKVGKTSLLSRYVEDEFRESYFQTLGANFLVKEVDVKNISNQLDEDKNINSFNIYVWDICGQRDKLFTTEYYFVQAVGALVVFDILNRDSFEDLDFWINKLKELSGDVPFIIIGNKIDEEEKRMVSKEEGQELADQYGVEYIETSAKSDENVDKAFEILAIEIIKKML